MQPLRGALPEHHKGGPLDKAVESVAREKGTLYLEYVSGHEYTKENFGQAALLGSTFLEAAGGWEEANRVLRRLSIERFGDHFQLLHEGFFDGLVHPALLEKAKENALWGIRACSTCQEQSRVRSNPHPSLKEYLEEAAAQLWKDARRGRALIVEDRGGQSLEGVISVPMARVPKMLPNRTLSTKGRVIWDATAVNRTCDKSNHPPALQPRHSEMARTILWWKYRFPFAKILLAKKDISDAFKWVPIRSEDTRLFAADLPGSHFGVGKTVTILYNALTFGWTGAPGEFMLYAWLAKLGHMSYYPERADWNDQVTFRSLVLMDDTVLVEPDIGIRPWLSVKASEVCTKAALGPDTINPEKDQVEGALEEKKLIWGLTYDTRRGTRQLPAAKLEKASYLLHLPEFDHGNKKVPLRLVQELRGNQQFWLTILPTMANFLQASNDLLGPADSDGFAVPRGNAARQQSTWSRFWEAIELQRLLVDNREVWESRFTHPMVESLSVPEVMALDRHNVRWASGDATLEKIAAVDWGAKKAYAIDAQDIESQLRSFMREAAGCSEAPSDHSECEDSGFIISIMELLAVVTLAALQAPHWEGKLVLYGGDNKNVISWLDRRHARHPVAMFLLQVLAALEATHAFRVHGAFIRTYHNKTADALTREDAAEVFQANDLTPLEDAKQALFVFLERGWTRRALVWAGQADADRGQALRLSQRRSDAPTPLEGLEVVEPLLRLTVLDLSQGAPRYASEGLLRGARCFDRRSWGDIPLRSPSLLCYTLPLGGKEALYVLGRGVLHARPTYVWVDTQKAEESKRVREWLRKQGYEVEVMQISGRTLKDSVWWRRWTVMASMEGPVTQPCIDASEEPVTEVPRRYEAYWFDDGNEAGKRPGVLQLDPATPYLGATTPKPAGVFKPEGTDQRLLVWNAEKPLPSLHMGSWDGAHPSNLLLEAKSKAGPVARPLTPQEAVLLLDGKPGPAEEEEAKEAAARALAAAPRSLARLAMTWVGKHGNLSGTDPNKVGLCQLRWENETEQVLYAWLRANPSTNNAEDPGRVGGRRGKQRDPKFYASKDLSRILRHEAGTEETPVAHEGWARWDHLLRHPKLRRYDEDLLLQTIQHNDKQRFVLRTDTAGVRWAAAWSGHTIPGCVGPSRVVPANEVPAVLIHGTYRRHVPGIEAKGILCQRRDIHLQDPQAHARRWRKDLEIRVEVDTVVAIERGCIFRVTGNLVWLCSQSIPAIAINTIRPWDDLQSERAVVGDVSGADGTGGLWAPDEEEWDIGPGSSQSGVPITEEIVAVAQALAPAADMCKGEQHLLVDSNTWEVEVKAAPEASFSPGQQEDECDWSEEEAEAMVVEAEPASSSKEEPQERAGPSNKTEAKEEDASMEPKDEADDPGFDKERAVRKVLRFGSAQLRILQEVAMADTANWEHLQSCIQKQGEANPQEKSQLLEQLQELAETRAESRDGALQALEECKKRTADVGELETDYRATLGEEARRLERYNPVGPRTAHPLITTNRLEADIAAGTGVWQARRAHRARERAARHRQAMQAAAPRPTGSAGSLVDVPTEAHGEVIDMTMQDQAKAALEEFRQELRREAAEYEKTRATRQKDSARRRKIKRERYKAKRRTRRTHDDADRDSNHAIAHLNPSSDLRSGAAARFAPGPLLPVLVVVLLFVGILALVSVATLPRRPPRETARQWYVGARKKKVRFEGRPAKRKNQVEPVAHVEVPFKGGPRTAARLHPPGATLRFAEVQSSVELEQESLALMLDRYSRSTVNVYKSQYHWWELFCWRRGIDPLRFSPEYNREEEQLVLDFIVHCASNEKKAPGTIKIRLAAIRSHHRTLGLPDPLACMPRVPLAVAGVKRRYGTKERRRPVTPAMLQWLGERLQYGRTSEGSLLWAALCIGFFFLLRASEYLDTGYVDANKGLRGGDVKLQEGGCPCPLHRISHADEVVVTIRGSKTDIYNKGESRNHFCSGQDLCPVRALQTLFKHFPQRYGQGNEAQELLFRTEDSKVVPRAAITSLIEQAAKALGVWEGGYGTHSLRFGGASAIWAAYADTTLVKRWGRWSSESFQTYVWDSRRTAKGVSEKMSAVDLTPI